MFPVLKISQENCRYESDEEVSDACEGWFRDRPFDFYSGGMHALFSRWEKCITAKESYGYFEQLYNL